jgi:hypothetical protein
LLHHSTEKKKNDLKKNPEKSRKFEKREIANTLFSEKKSGILYYSGIPLSLFCSLVQLNEYSAGTDRMRTREERRGEGRDAYCTCWDRNQIG